MRLQNAAPNTHDDWLGYEAMLDDLVINDGHQLSGTKFELLP